MHDVVLKPDPRKLTQYFNLTEEMILEIETSEGIPVALDYLTIETYITLDTKFREICMHYGLSDHFEELFFLLITKNENIGERYDFLWNNYNDDLRTREIAKFLLAYKEASSKTHLSLSLKPSIGSTASLKDTRMVTWICKVVIEQIEQGNYPLNVLGEKICYDLFGDFHSDFIPLDVDRLRVAADLKPKKPSTKIKRLYAELCLHLSSFLREHTVLTLQEGKLLTDSQANFYFDTLAALGYLNKNDFDSDPKDYIWAMLTNYINSCRTRL